MNARLPEIESSLRSELKIISVGELPDAPFSSHAEFRELHRSKQISIATPYDPGAMDLFARPRQLILHYILAWLPGAVIVTDIIGAFVTSHYQILWGIPFALAGFFLAAPYTTRFFLIRFFSTGAFLGFLYYCVHAVVPAFLFGSYIVSFLAAYIVRMQSYYVTVDAILSSELIFLWLYTRKLLLITRRT